MVAVDIVRPIAPLSEIGHSYILTLVDYTTRYPEAVPLKKITTASIAEAILNIDNIVGIPEEVLTDQGNDFMSECMQEVSRLLSIKGLTSMQYHAICNGLVEKWEPNPEVHAKEALPKPTEKVAQIDQPCSVRLQRSSPGVDMI